MSTETKIRRLGLEQSPTKEFWVLAKIEEKWTRVAAVNTLALAVATEKSYRQIEAERETDGFAKQRLRLCSA